MVLVFKELTALWGRPVCGQEETGELQEEGSSAWDGGGDAVIA